MLGAPMWTRICNLQMETELPPLAVRVKQTTAGLLAKICRSDKPTAAKARVSSALRLNNRVRGATWTHEVANIIEYLRATTLVDNIQDTRNNEYTVPPPWNPPPATFAVTALGDSKSNIQREELRRLALEDMAAVTPAEATSYFTDGSVDQTQGKCGAAFHTQGQTLLWRLSDGCSTLQTELVAISKALQHAAANHTKDIVIHTDSRTAVQTLQKNQPRDNINLITSILAQLQDLQRQDRRVILHWIPSHVGLEGNENADEAAKAATRFTNIQVHVPASLQQTKLHLRKTAKLRIKKDFLDVLNAGSPSARWYLVATRGEPPCTDREISRQTLVNLHRLRLGYKCTWQMIDGIIDECPYCQEPAAQPLEHYLLDCEVTRSLQARIPDFREDHVIPAASLVFRAQTKHLQHLLQIIRRYPPPR